MVRPMGPSKSPSPEPRFTARLPPPLLPVSVALPASLTRTCSSADRCARHANRGAWSLRCNATACLRAGCNACTHGRERLPTKSPHWILAMIAMAWAYYAGPIKIAVNVLITTEFSPISATCGSLSWHILGFTATRLPWTLALGSSSEAVKSLNARPSHIVPISTQTLCISFDVTEWPATCSGLTWAAGRTLTLCMRWHLACGTIASDGS